MTVRELIAELLKMPQHAEVRFSSRDDLQFSEPEAVTLDAEGSVWIEGS